MVSTLSAGADTGPRLGAPVPEGVGVGVGVGVDGESGVLLGASLLGGEAAGGPVAGTDDFLGKLSFDFFSSFSLVGRSPAPVPVGSLGVGVGVGVGGLGGLSDLQGHSTLSSLSPDFAYHGHAAAAPSLLLSELMDDSAMDADGAPGGVVGGSSGKNGGGNGSCKGNGSSAGGGGLLGSFAGGGGSGSGGSPPFLAFPAGAGTAPGDTLYFSTDTVAETERLRAIVGSLQAELGLERDKVEDLRYQNMRLQMRVQTLEDSMKSFGFNG